MCVCVCVCVCVSCSVVSDSLWPHGLQPARFLYLWNSPRKNTGVGSHSLLQGIFPTQGLNLGLLHWMQSFYCLNHQGSPHHVIVMEYYLTIKCKLFIYATTWMSLKNLWVKETKHTWLHLHKVLEQVMESRMVVASGSGELTERPEGTFWGWCEVKWKSFSRVRLFATPWTIQSMEFSRPEYWSG